MHSMGDVRKHVLTVSVEDYFHGASLDGVVARKHWTRIESRLEKSLKEVLDLLAEHQATATFFVLGWIAERQPEIVRQIRAAGHEIASRGYWPRGGEKGMLPHPQELREELQRAREALEAAGSNRIVGYRHRAGSCAPRSCGSSTCWSRRATSTTAASIRSCAASRATRAGSRRTSTATR
jgi:peptidoglycan/xylan/chitin deacetylase (PgdA/CDA1 family)